MNVIQAVQAECKRIREVVLPEYALIGAAGLPGLFLIKADLVEGEAAIASGSVTRMVESLQKLREVGL